MPKPPRRPTDAPPRTQRAARRPTSTTRKKTAAPPVPGRITISRVRTRSSAPSRPRLLQPGFPDVETATRYLLSRAEELVQDGVVPRRPADVYLDALVPVLSFIYARAELFREANLGPEVCGAVEQIAQELQATPEAPPGRPDPVAAQTQEAVSTAALLLTAYRDAIRRVARGRRGEAVRAHFAVAESVDTRFPEEVAHAIQRFLDAARDHPSYVAEAGLSPRQLEGLAAQRRVILARLEQQRRAGLPTPSQARTARVLHTALEYFFDRFSAAVSAKLLDHPEERLRGLRLVPRDPGGRAGGLRSTDPR
ncbi:MAG: hypothetical protein RMK29_11790 [Myxococcales bacterium]|nr:hypothetical protein [Myxococcota bacterium]MDW8282390.1 hypothetical protein [Myxococcales bacterium]